MMETNIDFGVLLSGHLGFKSLEYLWARGFKPKFVFTDKGSAEIVEFSSQNSIPIFVGNPRNGKGVEKLLSMRMDLDFMLSINYLFLVEEDLMNYPRQGCVNFHGSLLPRYRGRTPHVWAIINNEVRTGITAHYIDRGCDTGNIVLQREISITPEATGGDLLVRFQEEYPVIIEEIILRFLDKTIGAGIAQDEARATYYGKRTPEDGLIVWEWHRERIYNWVRAQSYPYPGAFAIYDDRRIIIDKIEFSDHGFHFEARNGVVLAGGKQPIIKTPNGAIRITAQRESINFQTGKLLL